GILVITMLWSVNLRIMGKSNIPLFGLPNLFDSLWADFTADVTAQLVLWSVVCALVVIAIWWFLRTQIGLAVRAVGANDVMAVAQGVNTKAVTIVGLGIASAFSAFCGASVAQVQGYADVAMGFG